MTTNIGQGVFSAAIGVVGLLSNSIVVIVLLGIPRLAKLGSAKFIINQSIIDALASLSIALSHRNIVKNFGYNIGYREDGNALHELLCRVWNSGMIPWSLMKVSTVNLVVLTLERYVKIVHPFFFKKYFSQTKVRIALVVPWIFGIAYQVGFTYNTHDVKNGACEILGWFSPKTGTIFGIVQFLLYFFIPIAIMVYSYTRIILAIRKGWENMEKIKKEKGQYVGEDDASDATTNTSVVNMGEGATMKISTITTGKVENQTNFGGAEKINESGSQKPCEASERRRKNMSKTQKKVIKALVTVCVGFFLCFVWNQTAFFLANVGVLDFAAVAFSPFYMFSVNMTFVNSVINPFIYAVQFLNFKHMPLSAFCPCIRSQNG